MFAEYISSHHYLAELVDTVSRAIEHRGYGVISCQSTHSFRQALRNFKLAGAVIIAPPEQLYNEIKVESGGANMRMRDPTVVIHSAVEQAFFNEVSPDISSFSAIATTHLVELGHRRLGYLGGPRPDDEPKWFDLRRTGIEQALARHDLPATSVRHQPCPDAELGPAALQQLLARFPQTTAVMCINDEVALAAVTGAEKLGLKVPHQLSIIGCNNIRLAQFFRPALTTLSIDIRALVETALDLLFDEIRRGPSDEPAEPVRIRIPASLIVRESTAPPARN